MTFFSFQLVLCSTVLHAAWNLLARQHRTHDTFFLQLLIAIAACGVLPLAFFELTDQRLPASVWLLAAASGFFLSLYYLGLTIGYRVGEFSLVYPLAQSLPVLLLAVLDAFHSGLPSPLGYMGIALVIVGCLLAPLESLREISWRHYLNGTSIWIAVIALGMTGCSTVDKLAAERLPHAGLESAIHYGILQFSFAVPFFWVMLRVFRQPTQLTKSLASWNWAALAAVLTFAAYGLVLWAYQLSRLTSYVVGVRQFSIVLGVTGAKLFFDERMGWPRLLAISLLTGGVILISLSK